MSKQPPMTMISVRVPQDLKDRITEASRKVPRTNSDFLRLFLLKYFPPKREREGKHETR